MQTRTKFFNLFNCTESKNTEKNINWLANETAKLTGTSKALVCVKLYRFTFLHHAANLPSQVDDKIGET
jgi:hypothetical protein